MKYDFNADLELKHISLEDRIAVYREEKKEGDFFSPATVLLRMGDEYVVASFNGCLYCNNAQGFKEYYEAWRAFEKYRETVPLDYIEEKEDPKKATEALWKAMGF